MFVKNVKLEDCGHVKLHLISHVMMVSSETLQLRYMKYFVEVDY
jgi:hypothetical protein